MNNPSVRSIKLAQKESLLLRTISDLFHTIVLDDTRLEGLTINRVKLSKDKSVCMVLFYTAGGQEEFKQKLKILTLYKPSLRKALADKIQSRYVPELRFAFDDKFEKQAQLEQLLDQIKNEESKD